MRQQEVHEAPGGRFRRSILCLTTLFFRCLPSILRINQGKYGGRIFIFDARNEEASAFAPDAGFTPSKFRAAGAICTAQPELEAVLKNNDGKFIEREAVPPEFATLPCILLIHSDLRFVVDLRELREATAKPGLCERSADFQPSENGADSCLPSGTGHCHAGRAQRKL